MGYMLPQKVRDLTPYVPAQEQASIRCNANESCFPLPPDMLDDVLKRLAALNYNHYPDPTARECVEWAGHIFGVSPERIVAGNGSDELIFLAESVLLQKGARLMTLEPDFSMYAFYASLAEHIPLPFLKPEDLRIDAQAVLSAVREQHADVLIFSNPCNPTSLLLSLREVECIVQGAPDTLVIVDEAYMEFAQESGASVVRLTQIYDNLLVLRTCSKAVGLAGARVGFAIAGTTISAALKSAKSPYNVSALSQAVAAAVLSHPTYVQTCAQKMARFARDLETEIRVMQERYPSRIETVYQTCTNFVLMKLSGARAVYEALADRDIAVRLMGDCLRISTAQPEDNHRLLEALDAILKEGYL